MSFPFRRNHPRYCRTAPGRPASGHCGFAAFWKPTACEATTTQHSSVSQPLLQCESKTMWIWPSFQCQISVYYKRQWNTNNSNINHTKPPPQSQGVIWNTAISGTEHKLTSTTHTPLSSHLSRQGQLLNRVLFAYQNSTLNLSKPLFWNLKQADGDFKVSFRINGSILYICVIKGPILLTPSRESMFHRWGHFCCHLSGGLLKTSRLWNDGFRSFCSLRLQKPWYPGFGNKINPFPDVSSGRTRGSLIQ